MLHKTNYKAPNMPEILTAVMSRIKILWAVTTCRMAETYTRVALHKWKDGDLEEAVHDTNERTVTLKKQFSLTCFYFTPLRCKSYLHQTSSRTPSVYDLPLTPSSVTFMQITHSVSFIASPSTAAVREYTSRGSLSVIKFEKNDKTTPCIF
jgi:hypothetical protein